MFFYCKDSLCGLQDFLFDELCHYLTIEAYHRKNFYEPKLGIVVSEKEIIECNKLRLEKKFLFKTLISELTKLGRHFTSFLGQFE